MATGVAGESLFFVTLTLPSPLKGEGWVRVINR